MANWCAVLKIGDDVYVARNAASTMPDGIYATRLHENTLRYNTTDLLALERIANHGLKHAESVVECTDAMNSQVINDEALVREDTCLCKSWRAFW